MEKWNYKKPTEYHFATQKDWNQTLVTMLNFISAKNKLKESTIKVEIPNRMKSIIKSLRFYTKGMIANKYDVEFINLNTNIINVAGYELMVENF